MNEPDHLTDYPSAHQETPSTNIGRSCEPTTRSQPGHQNTTTKSQFSTVTCPTRKPSPPCRPFPPVTLTIPVTLSIIGIGFCSQYALVSEMPGWDTAYAPTWGYHGDDGEKYEPSGKSVGAPYATKYGPGDVIGCGIDFVHGSIYYTKNGVVLRMCHSLRCLVLDWNQADEFQRRRSKKSPAGCSLSLGWSAAERE